MNNKAIAVKCSHHGPQIVRQRRSSSYTRIHSNYCCPWERSGRMHYVTRKINYTNARRPVSVKACRSSAFVCKSSKTLVNLHTAQDFVE